MFVEACPEWSHVQVRENVESINRLIKTHLSHLPFTILRNLYDCLSSPLTTEVGDFNPERRDIYMPRSLYTIINTVFR